MFLPPIVIQIWTDLGKFLVREEYPTAPHLGRRGLSGVTVGYPAHGDWPRKSRHGVEDALAFNKGREF